MRHRRAMRRDDVHETTDLRRPACPRVHAMAVGVGSPIVLSFLLGCEVERTSGQSAAELDVARLAIRVLSNACIAENRGTSVRTVANQMASILRKLELGSRREL